MTPWRYIDTGPSDAALNMAIDEAIAKLVRQGESPATLRMYCWESPSVTIGYFQRLTDIKYDYCEKKSIPVVRRPTGGRAILHDDEITYSFSAKETHHSSFKTLPRSYMILSRGFFSAMKDVGIDPEVCQEKRKVIMRRSACFESVSFGEISADGKKIVGSAQKRYRGGFLQQGSIPFSIDREVYQGIFQCPSDKFFGGLSVLYPHVRKDDLKRSIILGFEKVFQVKMIQDHLTEEELNLAQQILRSRYHSLRWNTLR